MTSPAAHAAADLAPADPQALIVPVTLEGRYIRLEPLAREHAEGLVAAARDRSIWTWVLQPQITTLEMANAYIDFALESRAAGKQNAFAIVDRVTGTVVGTTRYDDIRQENRSTELGWTWLAIEAQRTAVNTEAKLLLLTHAFESCGFVRIQIVTDSRNDRSLSAIRRIGATYEGTLRRSRALSRDGWARNTVVFSIIADEWPRVRAHVSKLLR